MGAKILRRVLLTAGAGVMLVAMLAVGPAATNVAVFASALRSPAAVNTAPGWSQGRLIDPLRGGPNSVSCPTVSFCAAVDKSGNVLTYDGSSWSKPVSIDANPVSIDSGGLFSVSCPTASFCAAVDYAGAVLTYDGSSWSSPDPIDPNGGNLNFVSCPTASFCAAVDGNGYVLTYNGSSWSQPVSVEEAYSFLSVSCPTAGFCAAVGGGDVLTYDGSAWSKSVSIDANGDGILSISCPTASFCAAVDNRGDVLTYDGSAWSKSVEHRHERGRRGIRLLPDGELLRRGGQEGQRPHLRRQLVVETSQHRRERWRTDLRLLPDGEFCAAVDNRGTSSPTTAASWSEPVSIDANPVSIDAGGLESVSCPTARFCAAVDYAGYVLTYNGSSWSSPKSIDPSKSGLGLYAVSCPTASFCATVDGNGNVLTYDGRSWSSPDPIDPNGGGLYSVSCPTAGFCAAVDWDGNALTYDGSSSVVSRPHSPVRRRLRGRVRNGTELRLLPVGEVLRRGGLRIRLRPHLRRQLVVLARGNRRSRRWTGLRVLPVGEVLRRGGRLWQHLQLQQRRAVVTRPHRPERGRAGLRLLPDGELLCPGGGRRRPHLRRQLVVVARPHKSEGGRPVVRLLPDGGLLRRGGLRRLRVHLGAARLCNGALGPQPQRSPTATNRPSTSLSRCRPTRQLGTDRDRDGGGVHNDAGAITLSSGNGSCRLAMQLGAGTYSLLATYDGSAAFGPSTSAKKTLTVAKATSKTALMLSAAKVTYGHEGTAQLSVTVSPQYAGSTPSGTVTVTQSTTTLCVITLSSGKGKCKLSPRKLKAGTYHLVATYGGNANFKASTSAKKTLTVAK